MMNIKIRELIDEGFVFRKTTDIVIPEELRDKNLNIFMLTYAELDMGFGVIRAECVDYNLIADAEFLDWGNAPKSVAAYKII